LVENPSDSICFAENGHFSPHSGTNAGTAPAIGVPFFVHDFQERAMMAKASKRTAGARQAASVAGLRLQVMRAIATHLKAMPGTQGEQADSLDISRPRLNALLKERVELFGLDSLAQIALRAGLSVRLSVSRHYTRRGGH
jgi:predicted XRE-type DNA-binding protein